MANLERVKRIIRELQQRTTSNGCTEAEALAAAEKMGHLLQEHDLEMDEVGMKQEAAAAKKQVMRAADDYASSMCVGISRLCDLIVYLSGHGEFTFFGTPHDLEIGAYLYEIVCEAAEVEWSKYMEDYGYSVKKRASFRMGFAHRINERLREIRLAREAARMKMSTATDLVVVKDQLVKAEFNKLGIRLNKARSQTAADVSAYYSGHAAGAKVNLNNPLTDAASNQYAKVGG